MKPIDATAIVARSAAIADTIDRFVAADPELALSLYGMGLDALATALRTKAVETYTDVAPWLALATDVFAYLETGAIGPAMLARGLTPENDPATVATA